MVRDSVGGSFDRRSWRRGTKGRLAKAPAQANLADPPTSSGAEPGEIPVRSSDLRKELSMDHWILLKLANFLKKAENNREYSASGGKKRGVKERD